MICTTVVRGFTHHGISVYLNCEILLQGKNLYRRCQRLRQSPATHNKKTGSHKRIHPHQRKNRKSFLSTNTLPCKRGRIQVICERPDAERRWCEGWPDRSFYDRAGYIGKK